MNLYTSFVDNYALTYAMFQWFKQLPEQTFDKWFVVADGTKNEACLNLLHLLEKEGLGRYAASKFSVQHFPIRRGPAVGLNYVIQQSLDQDVVLLPNNSLIHQNCLVNLAQTAESYPDALTVSSTAVDCMLEPRYHAHIQYMIQGVTEKTLSALEQYAQMDHGYDINGFFSHWLFRGREVTSGDLSRVVYFKKVCWKEIGYFDERLDGWGEEWDYSTRVTMANKLNLTDTHALSFTIWKGANRFSKPSEQIQAAKQRYEDKYHGETAEQWMDVNGWRQRKLLLKEGQDFVMVKGEKKVMLHAV